MLPHALPLLLLTLQGVAREDQPLEIQAPAEPRWELWSGAASTRVGELEVRVGPSGLSLSLGADSPGLLLAPSSYGRGSADGCGVFAQALETSPDSRLASRSLAAGVVERFEIEERGLEHSLLFAAPPPGDGDLVVRFEARTDLAFEGGPNGLLLVDGSAGPQLSIGGVTGIDAAGQRASGSLRHGPGFLEYVLPDEFIDQAAWPVLLDPLFGTVLTIDPDPKDLLAAAAASGPANVYLTAFTDASGSLLARRYNSSTGAVVGSTLSIDTTGRAREVVAGYCRLSNRFLLVWAQEDLAGQTDLWARSIEASTGALSSAVALTFTTGLDEWPLDLSSENTDADDELLLVYDGGGTQYLLRQVTVSTSAAPAFLGSAINLGLKPTGSGLDARAAISNHGGEAGTFLTAVRLQPTATSTSIAVRAVDRNAVLLGAQATLATQTLGDFAELSAPAVDGDGQRFVVVWTRTNDLPPGSFEVDLLARRCDYNSLLSSLSLGAGPTVLDNFQTDEGVPFGAEVCWTPEGTLVGVGLFLQSLQLRGWTGLYSTTDLSAIEAGGILANLPGPVGALTAQASGELPSSILDSNQEDEALLLNFDGASVPIIQVAPGVLRGRRFGSPGRWQDLGGGCGKGGKAFVEGAAIGFGPLRLSVDTDQISGTSFALIGNESSGLPCGGCVLRIDLTQLLVLSAPLSGAGSGLVSINLPNSPTLVGLQAAVQWATPVSGPLCTNLSCDFSNALRITLE